MKGQDEKVNIDVNRNFAFFRAENIGLAVRLLESEYIDYKNIIPAKSVLSITVPACKAQKALRALKVLSSDTSKLILCVLTYDGEDLTLSARSDNMNAKYTLDVSNTSEKMQYRAGYNLRFLSEAITSIETGDGENIRLLFSDKQGTLVVMPGTDNSQTNLVLPVKL